VPQVAVSSLPVGQSSVCWQLDAGFCCAIYSESAEVLECAARVFVSAVEDGDGEPSPSLCWRIEIPQRSEPWRAQGLTDSTPELEAGTLAELLTHIEYGALQGLLSGGTDSFFSLHAALLSKNGRSVMVVGPKEAGKSTLACALWVQRGWTLCCDDSVLVDMNNAARPAPRRVSLRHGSRALLGEKLWEQVSGLPATFHSSQGLLFHPHELKNQSPPKPSTQPDAVFFLARRESRVGSAKSLAIPPALGALALLPYSTFLLPRGEQLLCPSRVEWGDSLPRLAAFTARVPMFDLGRGPLDAMTREIERLVLHANPITTSIS
jgi:hypothetical protein